MENLKLKLKLAKGIPGFNIVKVPAQNLPEIRIDTFPEITEEDTINPRTKKPYKMTPERRRMLRERALKREQNKRIAKTAEQSKARKMAKSKKSV
jgi:hypothetical protein